MTTAQTDAQFFYDKSGYSYDPAKETKEQGRKRGARRLANAEAWASQTGVSFEWEQDDITNEEFSNSRPFYYLWRVLARDASGKVVSSLCGVDFGRDQEPWGQPYKRVVEAELALEAMP